MTLSMDENARIEFRLLTEDRIDEVLSIQAHTMLEECIAIGVGMWEDPGAPEEMQLIFREVIRDGATVIAVDIDTNQVAAVAFNKICARPRKGEKEAMGTFIEENLKHEACLDLVKFLDDAESSVDVFEKYNVNAAMELFYIGTDPRYRGRGIGGKIVRASMDFCRGLSAGKFKKNPIHGEILNEDIIPELVFGVFASKYSQRIVEKLRFDRIAVFRYEDYSSRGKRMSERIGATHETAMLAALQL